MSPSDINERRVNVFLTPEAKRMLEEMAHLQFPNLRRPVGTLVEQLVREAYVWYTKDVKERR